MVLRFYFPGALIRSAKDIASDLSQVYLDGLRDSCIQEVAALNGRMDLKEIQKSCLG